MEEKIVSSATLLEKQIPHVGEGAEAFIPPRANLRSVISPQPLPEDLLVANGCRGTGNHFLQ